MLSWTLARAASAALVAACAAACAHLIVAACAAVPKCNGTRHTGDLDLSVEAVLRTLVSIQQ